jgi:hypothetical protein
MKEMKAAVLYGKEQVRVETVPLPAMGPEDVLVRVKAALTCGTDVKVFRRGYHARMIVPPALFGHELVSEWLRPIPLLAASVSIAAEILRIFAKTCCSTMVLMRSSYGFQVA